MVVKLVDGSFRGNATPLIKGFVEDTDTIESTTVITWWYTGALFDITSGQHFNTILLRINMRLQQVT